ncbi:periphilin-1 isoform X4 [Excalfactoria chinensis]|uniref:periphilin-1 isoform X4 n=1 Tax=Excalfactoria chinensis TaxID=46218 RepID=UPI003B3A3F5F
MAYRRDEMWSEGRYDYERLPRERLPPRIHPDDDYHRVVNIMPKKPPFLDRPGEGSYGRYDDYSHAEYRDYEEGRSFAHERRSGPPHRGVHKDESGYRWPRDDHPMNRQSEYRESPASRRDSPHSRSGSSVSSRSYSPERSKAYPFHQSQHSRSKERTSVQSSKTSRDASPSGSTAVPSSKAVEKSTRLSEKELAEAASKWAAEKLEKADENNLPERTDYEAGSSAPLYVEQAEETETNVTDSTELYEDNQLLCRSKAIATKTKEIEQVYRQDCETFGMVVKMLIDKDPSLEKSIQFALRQNLHEIGERCIEELKHFIAQYDAANQDISESFKDGSY